MQRYSTFMDRKTQPCQPVSSPSLEVGPCGPSQAPARCLWASADCSRVCMARAAPLWREMSRAAGLAVPNSNQAVLTKLQGCCEQCW